VTLNNEGTGALTITSMTLSGSGAKNYSQTSNCGGTLAAAQTCTVTITFKPQTKATLQATLSIYDNDAFSASPQTVLLSGAGQ
jgi:Abnormal spindle-like microcephaly-assoc'd, ASPM-SPD-2-Hydin